MGKDSVDLSAAAILRDSQGKYVFVIQKPERWRNKDPETPYIAFGGIGGKLEKGENPYDALLREMLEEIGVEGKVISINENTIFMTPNELNVTQEKELDGISKPVIIFRNPQQEEGRKPFTDIWIYAVTADLTNAKPVDNPAIIYLEEELLKEICANEITLETALEKGAKVQSNIELPDHGILYALPTPKAISRLLEHSTLHLVTELKAILSGC